MCVKPAETTVLLCISKLCAFLSSPFFLFTVLGLGHGQDLILHLTTGRRNIQGDTRTTVSSGATTAASGDHTTSGGEGGATSHVDATSVAVEAVAITTTTTTSAQTGRITSSTLRNINSSNNSISSSKTIHEDDVTTSRNAQEAPLVVTLTTLTDPPRHYPGTRSILPLPHTPPLPNAGKPCCRLTKTPKM